jgi:hypothetical protein
MIGRTLGHYEILAVEQFHREEGRVGSGLEDRADVRVIECGRRACLALEPVARERARDQRAR